jgi:hypothetical protein
LALYEFAVPLPAGVVQADVADACVPCSVPGKAPASDATLGPTAPVESGGVLVSKVQDERMVAACTLGAMLTSAIAAAIAKRFLDVVHFIRRLLTQKLPSL